METIVALLLFGGMFWIGLDAQWGLTMGFGAAMGIVIAHLGAFVVQVWMTHKAP